MSTAAAVLGPLWPRLDASSRELAIELANAMAADIELFDRPGADREAAIGRAMANIGSVRREPGYRAPDEQAAEAEAAIVRRLIRAILDGEAPPEVDRPAFREHHKVVALVVAVVQGPLYRGIDDDEIPEAVREVAEDLHGQVEPVFDLDRVVSEATRTLMRDDD